jgi:hypothetical protein
VADNSWRHTANIPVISLGFVKLDARAFAPFPALLVIKSWTILFAGIIFIVFFAIISRKGYTFSTFKRKIRSMITGPIKSVRRLQ